MIKYKCPECKAANEEKSWNKSTAEHYDEAIFELSDFPNCDGCDFRCPSCGEMIMIEDIEKVEQMTTEINIDYYEELKAKIDKLNEKETPYIPTNQLMYNPSGLPFHEEMEGECKCGQCVSQDQQYCHNCGQRLNWID